MESELMRLGRKLLTTFHLSVPEGQTLPSAGMPFSVLAAVVAADLAATGWFPEPMTPGEDFGGGARLEARGGEVWVHEQHEIGVSRYSPVRSYQAGSVEEAVRRYIRANGGSPMDGIWIDWAR